MCRTNTSGYLGVSWSKASQKWGAYIKRDGVRRYLGLFDTAEAAHAAYREAEARYHVEPPEVRQTLLSDVSRLYDAHGIGALSIAALRTAGAPPSRIKAAGFSHAGLLEALGLADEYAKWRAAEFTYGGVTKQRLTWETAVALARDLNDSQGDLPTVQWCRLNGHGALTAFIFLSGRKWEDLRAAIGLPPSVRFYESRNRVRWRSRPEASLSNFLYARGIEHKRGERYADGYSEQSGRQHGRYDLHFRSPDQVWINVEVWGDLPDSYSGGRYEATRQFKETWHAGDPTFLGIQYKDCLSDLRLTEALAPYIGVIAPFIFDKPSDRTIETSHWSDTDDFLETCRQLAAEMPDGIFPGDEWLRKRGRYADRPGPAYTTISQRVNAWFHGTRKVRELLGQSGVGSTAWTAQKVTEAWADFERRHGLTPTQCMGSRRRQLPREVGAEASKIYQAARRHGVAGQANHPRRARKVTWTREYALAEWGSFVSEHGLKPTQCMSPARRQVLPRAVVTRAANIYSAVRRLGLQV